MMQVTITATPNQQFQVQLDGNLWNLTLRYVNGAMAFSANLNGIDLINNITAAAGSYLIPYQYLESGNFFFITQNYDIVDYTQFGITQSLIYISASEFTAYRTPTSYLVNAADFNPIAPLPQRFSPTW